MPKDVLIWGAGKIARGFIAEAFYQGGYHLTFIDADQTLVTRLKEEGKYTLVKAPARGEPETLTISGYTVFHVSEGDQIRNRLQEVPYVGIAVFPSVFESVARSLAEGIEQRAREGTPLDIIVCANARGAAEKLRASVERELSDGAQAFLSEKVGFVETVIMRIGVPTPDRFAAYGDLTVTTNDSGEGITIEMTARTYRYTGEDLT